MVAVVPDLGRSALYNQEHEPVAEDDFSDIQILSGVLKVPGREFFSLARPSSVRRRRAKRMPLTESLTLGWWDKWRHYGRIPYKLVLQLALVILMSILVRIWRKATTTWRAC